MMDEIRKKAAWIYKSMSDTHEQAFVLMNQINSDTAKTLNLEKIADVTAMLKKTEELNRSLRAELNKTLKGLQKVGCMIFLRDNRLGETVRGEWVTVHPDTKTIPPIPRKSEDPEGYRAFCEYFGVPEAVIESGAFKPHWPSICEYVTANEGKGDLPPGVDPEKCTTEYTLVCRWVKDVEPDSVVEELMLEDPYSYPLQTRS